MKAIRVFLIIFTLTGFELSYAKGKFTNKITHYEGVVLSCHDGDTCKVDLSDKVFKVRFSGIDAPELKQPEGLMARIHLENIILNKTVNLECEGKSYDRTTCTVYLNQKNINEQMVLDGMALDSPKYSKGKYNSQMVEARSKKIGIWKTLERSPACFRHKNKSKCHLNPLEMF